MGCTVCLLIIHCSDGTTVFNDGGGSNSMEEGQPVVTLILKRLTERREKGKSVICNLHVGFAIKKLKSYSAD